MFFLGENFVPSLISTLKAKKPLKTFSKTRKPCYRKENRAMRPIYGVAAIS